MKNKYNKIFIILAFIGIIFSFQNSANSQTITQIQQISFGTFVLNDFSNVGEITIDDDGTFSNNAYIYIITDPQRGEYFTSSQPASTAYTISVTPTSTTINRLGNYLTIDNWTTGPATLVTNGSGEDTFYIGARMTSRGGGITYADGLYTRTFNITLNW